jgi:NADH-quinone oxidoreductase subunit E
MLTSESLKRIDREIAKYPADQKQSAVMAALAIAQEEQGWLSQRSHRVRCQLSRHGADRRL